MTDLKRLVELRNETDPAAARSLALELLRKSRRREVIDSALRVLESSELDDSERPALRDRLLYYMDNPNHDKTLSAREKLVRLLATIGSPLDIDLYLRGVNTYEVQPMLGEVAQNLRAASLVGLALADSEQGSIYAAKLLSEIDATSLFNGEPAVTAINLLNQQGRTLPIYQYLLLAGMDALELGQNEVVGRALESLGRDFPVELYRALAETFIPRDRAVVSMGIVSYILEQRSEPLYPLVEQIITQTRHHDLHHYAVVMLAASRDSDLIQRLYTLARLSPAHRIDNFIKAVELTPGDEKNTILERLRNRLIERTP